MSALTISFDDLSDIIEKQTPRFSQLWVSDRPSQKAMKLETYDHEDGDYSTLLDDISLWIDRNKVVTVKFDKAQDFKHSSSYAIIPDTYGARQPATNRRQSGIGGFHTSSPYDDPRKLDKLIEEKVEHRMLAIENEQLRDELATAQQGGTIGSLLANPTLQQLLVGVVSNMLTAPPQQQLSVTGFNSGAASPPPPPPPPNNPLEGNDAITPPQSGSPLAHSLKRLALILSADGQTPISKDELTQWIERLCNYAAANPTMFNTIKTMI